MTAVSGVWSSHSEAWGSASAVQAAKVPVLIDATYFYSAEEGTEINGAGLYVMLERAALTVYGRGLKGEYKSSPSIVKKLHGIWPLITGSTGSTISVYAGFHDTLDGPVQWEGPQTFTIGTTEYVDFTYVEGKYLAVKFESTGMPPWRLLGYDLDLEIAGEH